MSGLGQIQKIDLREAWPNEASSFTPWLEAHIAELGGVLGLDLEVEAREAPVGPYSLDLLARDTGTGRPVIIENQLEPTDHDHLGKLLTYAGGYDANVIVWVAQEFKEEHRQALDWLNQRTSDETEFFAVRVEVWRIDDSRSAPHFTLVAAPNEWRRGRRRDELTKGPSERMLRYQAFFQPLIDDLHERGFTYARRAPRQSWYNIAAGRPAGVVYRAAFGHGQLARVEVYINSTARAWNKSLFDLVKKRRESIEGELGTELEWSRLDEGLASRIALVRAGSIDDDDGTLDEIRAWMIEWLLTFKRVFGPVLDEVATEVE